MDHKTYDLGVIPLKKTEYVEPYPVVPKVDNAHVQKNPARD